MRLIDPDGRSYTDYIRRDGTRSVEVKDGNNTIESIEPLPEAVVYPNYGWTASTQGGVTRQYNQYDSPLTKQSMVVGEAPLEQVNIEFDMLLMGRLAVNAASSVATSAVAENTATTSGATLVSMTEETFSQALLKGAENIGNYSIYGTKGLVGKTFNRNIFLLEASEGKSLSGFRALVGSMESEALGAGANKISIYGSSVINKGFLNPNIATRFGYSFEQSGTGVFLQKTLKP